MNLMTAFVIMHVEQKELTGEGRANREMVRTCEQGDMDSDGFAPLIQARAGITGLTPTIINKFAKKIIIHMPDKSNCHRRQKTQMVGASPGTEADVEHANH